MQVSSSELDSPTENFALKYLWIRTCHFGLIHPWVDATLCHSEDERVRHEVLVLAVINVQLGTIRQWALRVCLAGDFV